MSARVQRRRSLLSEPDTENSTTSFVRRQKPVSELHYSCMSDSDEFAGDCGNLFVNEEYATKDFAFGAHSLRLLVSSAACTDHDLTGQLDWPGARLLCRWLALQPDAFFAKPALELGAGTGLTGLLYAARGGDCLLTDYHPVVLRLLRRNAEAAAAAGGAVAVAKLPWGSEAGAAALPRPSYEVLLGADILYPGSQRALPLLMQTVTRLLAPGGCLLLCYCSRAATTDAALAAALSGAGLVAAVAPDGGPFEEGGVSGSVFRVTRQQTPA